MEFIRPLDPAGTDQTPNLQPTTLPGRQAGYKLQPIAYSL